MEGNEEENEEEIDEKKTIKKKNRDEGEGNWRMGEWWEEGERRENEKTQKNILKQHDPTSCYN